MGGVKDHRNKHGEEDSRARKKADRAFLWGMVKDAWRTSWWKAPFYMVLAWTYYKAVRKLGVAAFTFRETQEEVDGVTVAQLMKEAA